MYVSSIYTCIYYNVYELILKKMFYIVPYLTLEMAKNEIEDKHFGNRHEQVAKILQDRIRLHFKASMLLPDKQIDYRLCPTRTLLSLILSQSRKVVVSLHRLGIKFIWVSLKTRSLRTRQKVSTLVGKLNVTIIRYVVQVDIQFKLLWKLPANCLAFGNIIII